MRRKTPLLRKTPIARSKTRIPSVSPRRKKQLREYEDLRLEFIREHPLCHVWLKENAWTEQGAGFVRAADLLEWEAGNATKWRSVADMVQMGAPRATQIHHMNKRRGDMLNNRKYWLAVSHFNHEWIENHKQWARDNGYLMNF